MLDRLFRLLGLVVIVVSLVSGWLLMDIRQFVDTPLALPEHGVDYEIGPGMGVIRIATDLERHGILTHARYLSWYARWQGDVIDIKAGRYRLEPGLTPRRLLKLLHSGAVIQYPITVPEGYTFKQLRELLDINPEIDHRYANATNAEIMAALGRPGAHPEGLFFPDTYHFTARSTDLSILQRAMEAMQVHLDAAWQGRAEGLPYKSPYEALIMASIIEKETSLEEERTRIAGVFVRRLEHRMRLQTDPTVIYGLGDRFHGNLHRRDLKADTPYNTYVHRGLPPTPIAMPGLASIDAALHPDEGESLYFVSKGDGSHQFSDTLKDHLKAVRRYQLGEES
ncbi:MAG: endolytic transglycosylase MltG [Gammaproteobacteria bacterium]|nr:endolytic transglycosylase MltG [Gammaproteobacteria bacterium]